MQRFGSFRACLFVRDCDDSVLTSDFFLILRAIEIGEAVYKPLQRIFITRM